MCLKNKKQKSNTNLKMEEIASKSCAYRRYEKEIEKNRRIGKKLKSSLYNKKNKANFNLVFWEIWNMLGKCIKRKILYLCD